MDNLQALQDELASKQRERSETANKLNQLQREVDALQAQISSARHAQRLAHSEQPTTHARGKKASEAT